MTTDPSPSPALADLRADLDTYVRDGVRGLLLRLGVPPDDIERCMRDGEWQEEIQRRIRVRVVGSAPPVTFTVWVQEERIDD